MGIFLHKLVELKVDISAQTKTIQCSESSIRGERLETAELKLEYEGSSNAKTALLLTERFFFCGDIQINVQGRFHKTLKGIFRWI